MVQGRWELVSVQDLWSIRTAIVEHPKLGNLSGMDIGLGAGKIVWLTKHCILSGNTSIKIRVQSLETSFRKQNKQENRHSNLITENSEISTAL